MSDTQPAPDWWKASDGKWYPPQSAAAAPPPPGAPAAAPPQKKKGGCGKLLVLGFLAVLAIAVIAAVAGGGKDDNGSGGNDNGSDTAAPTQGTRLFPGRPDAHKEDHESYGEVSFSGYTTAVQSAGFVAKVSDFEDDGYIKASVLILNRDDKAQPYNLFDWKLQTPNGQVLDPDIVSAPMLSSGDLVNQGTVKGDIYFEVGATKGDYYIIYKPDPFDAARGIWKVTVS